MNCSFCGCLISYRQFDCRFHETRDKLWLELFCFCPNCKVCYRGKIDISDQMKPQNYKAE